VQEVIGSMQISPAARSGEFVNSSWGEQPKRLLGHRSGSTTERYQNQARSVEASRLMQKFLLAPRNNVDPKQ
jgi:hypothetical protein